MTLCRRPGRTAASRLSRKCTPGSRFQQGIPVHPGEITLVGALFLRGQQLDEFIFGTAPCIISA
jgi:hypothetical protein